MLMATKPQRVARESLNNQMFFSFAETAQKAAPRRRKPNRTVAPPRALTAIERAEQSKKNSREQSLGELAVLLHQLAQKHVSRANFQDFQTLVQCAKLLQGMGLDPVVSPDMVAPVDGYNPAVVIHAPQYRLMRNRAVAALATVADLAQRAPAKGTPDYQKGVRDGYAHASDVALFFLDDLDSAFDFRSKPSRV